MADGWDDDGLPLTQTPAPAASAGGGGDGEELPSTQEPSGSRLGPRLVSDGITALGLDRPLGAVLSVGRAHKSDLVLEAEDTRLSRQHARLELGFSGWVVTDVGSKFGSTLNGVTLLPGVPAELHDGDVLAFGQGNDDTVHVDAPTYTIQGLGKLRPTVPPMQVDREAEFTSDQRNYMRRSLAALEEGLRLAGGARGRGDFEATWRAIGGCFLKMVDARDDFVRRNEHAERDARWARERAARRERRFGEHDEGRGTAPARKRRAKGKQAGGGGGGGGGNGWKRRVRGGGGGRSGRGAGGAAGGKQPGGAGNVAGGRVDKRGWRRRR